MNAIPRGSEIFRACRALDIDRVRQLFDQGLASPYDIDDFFGHSLLEMVAGVIPVRVT